MSTSAGIGHGTKFAIGNGATPEVFTDAAGVTSLSGPGLSRDMIDVTDMDSPDGYREFIGALKDAGEVQVDLEFDPDGSTTSALLSLLGQTSAKNFRITFPDTTAWAFSGWLSNFEPSDPHDDKMTASATFKVTGKPAFLS